MHLTSLAFYAALIHGLNAVEQIPNSNTGWEMTAYTDVGDCHAATDTTYRIYDGTDEYACHNFRADDINIKCQQFGNGGFAGPNTCGVEILTTKSVRVRDGNYCEFYFGADCDPNTMLQQRKIGNQGCVGTQGEGDHFQSFSCRSTLPNP